jgi:hypothetical protein
MRKLRTIGACLLLSTALWGCDSSPGVQEDGQRAPEISGLLFDPSYVSLDALPSGSVVDGVASFSIEVSVDVSDADGDLSRVFVLVQSPLDANEPIALVETDAPGNGRVSIPIDLEVPTAEVGLYTVRAYVSDQAGNLGNQVIGTLEIDAEGEPPVIESIQIPEKVTRPDPGQPAILITITAQVSDPDGAANILWVRTVVNGGATLNLCDDGGSGSCNSGSSSGDEVAGDGKYTLVIQLNETNQAGSYEFAFTARDRAGLQSQTEVRTMIVE